MFKTLWVFSLIALLFLSSLGATLYRLQSPKFVNDEVRKVNLYGRLTDPLPKLIPNSITKDIGLSATDAAEVLKAAVPPQTFYSFTDAASIAYLNYFTGRTSSLNFQYDLTPVKQSIRDKAVGRLLALYDALPTCDAKQLKTWSTDNGLPTCKLPESNVRSTDTATLLAMPVDKAMKDWPDHLTTTTNPQVENIKNAFSRGIRATQIVWGLTLASLLLFLLAYRHRAFLSLAFTFLLTGAIVAVFGFIAWDWVGKLIINLIPDDQASIALVIASAVTSLLALLRSIMANFSIMLLAAGFIFLLLGIFHRRQKVGGPTPQPLALRRK